MSEVHDPLSPYARTLPVPPPTIAIAGFRRELASRARVDRALGSLLGLAVGDALGSTNELSTREAPPFPTLATGPLTDLTGEGPFGLKPGQVTDDAQMAAALADVFIHDEGFSVSAVAARYDEWEGVAFDVGVQVGQALELIRQGCPAERAGRLVWEEQRRYPAGNGSLMRTAVIGVLFAPRPDTRRSLSLTESCITHFDPRCQLACAAYNAAIAHALLSPLPPSAKSTISGIWTPPTPSTMVRAAAAELPGAAALMRAWYPDIITEIDRAEAALVADLAAAGENDPRLYGEELDIDHSSGFVRVAFRLAFWELMHAPNVASALIDVVNRGGDADTNAAITGGLLGAFYGIDGVPRPWVDKVLAAPGLRSARWDYHPRVLVRAVERGYGTEAVMDFLTVPEG